MEKSVTEMMEPAFGTDFGHVRVHVGPQSDALSRAVSARAFTLGPDIFFARGEYEPSTTEGRQLLAHELTHVLQQSGAPQYALAVSDPGDPLEREAERVGRMVGRITRYSAGALELAGDTSEQSIGRFHISRSNASGLLQRAIDTSVMLETISLSRLVGAIPFAGHGISRDMESKAYASFLARNPVLSMQVNDTWYYYIPAFTNTIAGTRSWWEANLVPTADGSYYSYDDVYSVRFSYAHTGTRERQGTFTTTSGRADSVTDTISGGAKLTLDILEISGSASRATTAGTSSSTTVQATNFFEHDYDVTMHYAAVQYDSSNFRVRRDFWGPHFELASVPAPRSGSVAIGSITLYDDDSNPDNLTP